MNLHQINVAYDPGEDRLLLRFSTTDATEFRFWLTRRMVAALGPALMQRLQPADVPAAPGVGEEMLAFQHQAALQKTKFDQNYQPATPAPQMAEPVLVHRLQHRKLDNGQHVLALGAKDGPTAQIQLNETLMHGLVKLVDDALVRSEWGLRWAMPTGTPAASGQVM